MSQPATTHNSELLARDLEAAGFGDLAKLARNNQYDQVVSMSPNPKQDLYCVLAFRARIDAKADALINNLLNGVYGHHTKEVGTQ